MLRHLRCLHAKEQAGRNGSAVVDSYPHVTEVSALHTYRMGSRIMSGRSRTFFLFFLARLLMRCFACVRRDPFQRYSKWIGEKERRRQRKRSDGDVALVSPCLQHTNDETTSAGRGER